ncbi:conjugal transfer protein TraD [Hephaestia mangrovi]|uniref:conjugal transfer protein TraD n=1 Tax=Hephaestia mangrovi TaxID=2873268 RepID=UPI001CA65512|nr:conjugal transfer protein TraD [Hephaestia mangrovi]MBY8828527.1 conjugal transfer protein TraD [Hephaestia mangrovi]
MRKPRDFDAELKALDDRARQLKQRKVQQLGELVMATGADALPVEELAGALLAVAAQRDAATKAAWRSAGEAFFRGDAKAVAHGNLRDGKGVAPGSGAPQPTDAKAGAS